MRSLRLKVLSLSQYSSDSAPTDFYLFRLLEYFVSGRRFKNKEVENSLLLYLSGKNLEFFKCGTENWLSIVNNI